MEKIHVAVRIRPEEKASALATITAATTGSSSSSSSCVDVQSSSNALKISKRKDDGGSESFDFTFDNVWGTDSSQDDVFNQVKQLIDESLNGFSVTIFAFGMTGSGKTYTISGSPSNPGIVPRAVSHIFSDLQRTLSSDSVAMVFLTYVELYNNVLYDLLAPEMPGEECSGLRLHEHPKKGVTITGSPTIRTPVCSAEEAMQLISRGNKLRATSSTNLNERSSRSHTVISFEIVSQDSSSSSAKIGKINLVDLAGSERVKLSGAEGQALEEAKQINKALSVLGDVLNSLSKFHQSTAGAGAKEELSTASSEFKSAAGSTSTSLAAAFTSTAAVAPHIPYRNSKLTMLLKDSLGGNAKTMMIATIRQSSAFYQQSLLSLRYAARARHIKCSPVQNVATMEEDDPHAMHETLQQVNRLQTLLETRNTEFGELKSRLKELEDQGGPGDSTRMEKEKHYKEQIETVRKRSAKERQELQEHLRCVIRNHAGALAAKEREFGTMEEQLQQQSSQIRSLSREKLQALRTAEQAEAASQRLREQLAEQERQMVLLRTEKTGLERQLTGVTGRLSAAAEGTTEREQLVDALQKVTESRNKHKKRAEEYQGAVTRLTGEVAQRDGEIRRLGAEYSAAQQAQETEAHVRAQAQVQIETQTETETEEATRVGEASVHLQLQLEEQQQQQRLQLQQQQQQLELQQQQQQHRQEQQHFQQQLQEQLEQQQQLRQRIQEAAAALQGVEQDRDDLQSRLAAAEAAKTALAETLLTLQSSAEQAASDHSRTQEEKLALTLRLAAADEQARHLLEEKQQWGADKSTLKAQIKALSAELQDSLRREGETRSATDARLAESHAAAAAAEARVRAAEMEVEVLRGELSAAVALADSDSGNACAGTGAGSGASADAGTMGDGVMSPSAGAALALEIELSLSRAGRSRDAAQTPASPSDTGKVVLSDVQSQTSPSPPSHRQSPATADDADQRHENEVLKTRITQLVSQEKDMFSTLSLRLHELDEARTKLLRLKTSAAKSEGSSSSHCRMDGSDDDPLGQSSTGAPLSTDQKGRLDALELELRQCKEDNKRLRRETEKHRKHLALERQLSQSYLGDLERVRIETAAEVSKTVAVVREKVAADQGRRHSVLVSYLDSLPGSANTSMVGGRSRAGSLTTEDDGVVIGEVGFVQVGGGEGIQHVEGGAVGECLRVGGIASLMKTNHVAVAGHGNGQKSGIPGTGNSCLAEDERMVETKEDGDNAFSIL